MNIMNHLYEIIILEKRLLYYCTLCNVGFKPKRRILQKDYKNTLS